MITDLKELLQRLECLPDSPNTEARVADCEGLADALLGLGAAAAAARWRTYALMPPGPAQLADALEDLRLQLVRLGVLDPADTAAAHPSPQKEEAHTKGLGVLAGHQPMPPPNVVSAMAQAMVEGGNPDAALQLLRLQAVNSSLHPDACLAVASLLADLQQPWDAERWLSAGIQRLPDHQRLPNHWFLLARLLLLLGVMDEALAAVEQGLALDPHSNWGRNIRARILLQGGSWRSFDQLATSPGGLPTDPALSHFLLQERRRWNRSPLGPSHAPAPPPLSLPHRLRLRRLLSSPQRVVVLHGHGVDPLCWLQTQDVLPRGLTVQPLASREPLLLADALASAGFQVCPELPSNHLAAMVEKGAEPLDLLLVQRPALGRLPAALGALLPRVRCLIAPVGLFMPQVGVRIEKYVGWEFMHRSPDE